MGGGHPPGDDDVDREVVDVDEPDAVPVVPIEDSIDLHGFQPRDAPSLVEA